MCFLESWHQTRKEIGKFDLYPIHKGNNPCTEEKCAGILYSNQIYLVYLVAIYSKKTKIILTLSSQMVLFEKIQNKPKSQFKRKFWNLVMTVFTWGWNLLLSLLTYPVLRLYSSHVHVLTTSQKMRNLKQKRHLFFLCMQWMKIFNTTAPAPQTHFSCISIWIFLGEGDNKPLFCY